MFFLTNVWPVFAVPAVSFWLIILIGKRLPWKGHEIGIPAIAFSLFWSCAAAYQWITRPEVAEGEEHLRHAVETNLFTWFSIGGHKTEFSTHVDGFTVAMLFLVSLVSLMVHIYSTSYMEGDRRYTHYYAALSLFTASMLTLVVADNTLQLMIGWELVGLCSFMLIGHWWEEKPNSDAALKAFFTTRTGDVGLMIGIIILFFAAGRTFNIERINELSIGGEISHGILLVAAVSLFLGVQGK